MSSANRIAYSSNCCFLQRGGKIAFHKKQPLYFHICEINTKEISCCWHLIDVFNTLERNSNVVLFKCFTSFTAAQMKAFSFVLISLTSPLHKCICQTEQIKHELADLSGSQAIC